LLLKDGSPTADESEHRSAIDRPFYNTRLPPHGGTIAIALERVDTLRATEHSLREACLD